MAAVIGFVSLILVIVAMITSATLGSTLEDQLQRQLHGTADQMEQRVTQLSAQAKLLGSDLSAEYVLGGVQVRGGPDMLLVVVPTGADATGTIITESSSVLPLTASAPPAISASVYGTPTVRSAFMCGAIEAASTAVFSSHG